MITKHAIDSLRRDRSKAVFLFLTFYITTTLFFLFLNMAEASTQGKSEFYLDGAGLVSVLQFLQNGNISNILMVFVVIFCCIDLFFANDFFVKTKAHDLGVRLICGATFTQMLSFLMIQIGILIGIAIPLGTVTGIALIPFLNRVLTAMGSEFLVSISSKGVAGFIGIEAVILFWITLLNSSFAYQSGARLIFGSDISRMMKKEKVMHTYVSRFTQTVKAILSVLLAVIPVYYLFQGTSGTGMIIVLCCAGLWFMQELAVTPLITSRNRKTGLRSTSREVSNGYVREDLSVCRITILMYLITCGVLLSLLYGRENSQIEQLLIILSYGVMTVLQAMTIMFRLETNLVSRKEEFVILGNLGASQTQIRSTMKREIRIFYGIIGFLSLFYVGLSLLSLYMQKAAGMQEAVILMLTALVPVIIFHILTDLFYHSVYKDSGIQANN